MIKYNADDTAKRYEAQLLAKGHTKAYQLSRNTITRGKVQFTSYSLCRWMEEMDSNPIRHVDLEEEININSPQATLQQE